MLVTWLDRKYFRWNCAMATLEWQYIKFIYTEHVVRVVLLFYCDRRKFNLSSGFLFFCSWWLAEEYLFAAQIYDGALLQIFLQKCSLIDVWLGSKYTSGWLEAPYEMAPLNSFILLHWKKMIANFARFTLIYKHHLHNITS